MADSKETIKASFTAPTHRVVDGVQVDLTAEEIEETLNTWAENELAKQLDEEANGWLKNRQAEYPSLEDCIHALLDGGDTLTDLQALRTQVKSDNPKPS